MGFIKKLKKGVKKTGGALKSGAQKTGGAVKTGAKATGKGIAKGAKHVAAIPKNTYKTTKQLGGALKKPVSHLINDSFSDIVVAILKIPAILTVYGLALCVGILLAVFLGTNSSNIWQGINVFPCEWNFSASYNNYSCKCTRSSCRIAYPSECSSVVASLDACFQISNSPSSPSSNSSNNSTDNPSANTSINLCVPPIPFSDLWVESATVNNGEANIIFTGDTDLLEDIGNSYDQVGFYVDDILFEDKWGCTIKNPDCRGPALPSSTAKRDIPVKIIGVLKLDPVCTSIGSGKPFTGPPCELFASSMKDGPIKNAFVKYTNVVECPIYSTTINSSQISLAPSRPISGRLWADSTEVYDGDCTTLHWTMSGDIVTADIGVESDIPNPYATNLFEQIHVDPTKQDSYEICPRHSPTYAIFLITDPNGAEELYRVDITVLPRPVEQASKPDRCDAFKKNMSVIYLDWTSGSTLTFYIKMPGGVPGLEKNISGDTQPWNYSASIGTATTNNCGFEGYKERLYCTITLPSGYANTIRPLAVSVNGCSSPIFTDSMAAIPGYEAGSETNSCGQSPVYNAPSCSSWCACMGGTLNISCGGGECTIVGSPPCSDYCSIP